MRRRRPHLHWNDKVPGCINCGSDRHDRRNRGYCSRCFRYAEPLRIIDQWDAQDYRTWHGSGYQVIGPAPISPSDYLAALRKYLESGLATRQVVEQQARGELAIDGMDFEYLFGKIGAMLHTPDGRDQFRGWATTFDHALDQKARELIYTILIDLVETKRQRSVYVLAWYAADRKQKRDDRKPDRRDHGAKT